jgi:hypothetical protein
MPYSVVLDLEDGGQVIYDNVISCTIEEAEEEPSPDEVPEEGEEEREGNEEVDMTLDKNPMDEEEEESKAS